MLVVVLTACLISLGTVFCVQHNLSPEEKLILNIVEPLGRHSLASPAADVNQTVPVNVGLSLTRIQSYDEENRYVTVSAWLRITWTDLRLKWNPKDYENLGSISIPVQRNIWYPDIKLFNGIKPDVEKAQVNAVVFSNGEIFWMSPIRFTVSCDPIKQYVKPYAMNDTPYSEKKDQLRPPVRCKAMFGSWTYDNSKIEMRTATLDMNAITENPLFIVADALARKTTAFYEMSDKEWVDATFTFSLSFRDPRKVIPA